MTDSEIKAYLNEHNWSVDAHDFTIDVFNTSRQIIYEHYDRDTGMMTLITPENEFSFKWNLKKY